MFSPELDSLVFIGPGNSLVPTRAVDAMCQLPSFEVSIHWVPAEYDLMAESMVPGMTSRSATDIDVTPPPCVVTARLGDPPKRPGNRAMREISGQGMDLFCIQIPWRSIAAAIPGDVAARADLARLQLTTATPTQTREYKIPTPTNSAPCHMVSIPRCHSQIHTQMTTETMSHNSLLRIWEL